MKLDAIKKKELRGQILVFLGHVNPYPISRESIYETLYEYWQTEDILQALQYLVDGGYVEEKVIESPFGSAFDKIHNYRITKKGVDLCDLTITDEGVHVRR